jgi:cell division protein FtsI (penicillin-binding protein 3)
MNQVSDKILKRVYLLFGGIALFALIIIARVVQIQFIQADKWIEAVEKERVYEKHIPAARGNILADGGEVLATSQPFYMLPIDPSRIDTAKAEFPAQLDSLCKLLGAHFGDEVHDANYFHDYLMQHIRFRNANGLPDRHLYVIRQKVDFEDYRMVREWPILRNSKFEGGLMVEKLNNTRFYPYDSLARITLGVIAHDSMPLKGLEFSFHKYLKGVEGIALVQRITGGTELPLQVFQEDVDGADIETTLDVGIQDIVETELRSGVLRHNAKYGVAVLMEVATGEIKAVANYPETQNHALASRIEPGSTFKLASFMAMLEDGKIDLDDSIDAQHGVWRFYDRTMKDHVAYDKISFRDAFEESVNTVTARMVDSIYGRNPETWYAHLEKFGLTNPVMVQEHIVGEPIPHFVRPGESDWTKITMPWMAIGYNSQLTPLQILTFYNAVANGGKLMEPILVKRIRQGSKVIVEYESKVLSERIANENTLKEVHRLLEGVVERGTARRVQIGDCQLAGKTGTAKKYNKETGEYESRYQASFCGYFPAKNPRYSLYIMVDEPSNEEYYGASVAGPIFAEIAQQVYTSDMDLVPEFMPPAFAQSSPMTRVVHQGNAQAVYRQLDRRGPTEAEGTWVKTKENGGRVEFTKLEIKPGRVPNVYGMSAKDAVVLLETLGMKVLLNGHGKVKTQSVGAGAPISGNTSIILGLN